jgi:hydrogenase maturation protease
MNPPNTLIIGVGNILLGDEGVGIHVVQRLPKIDLPTNVEVIDGGTGGFELFGLCQNRKKIIVIDAMLSDAEPGSVFRATPEEFTFRWGEPLSAHHGGLREFFFAVQTLSPRPEIVIFGIVPKNIMQPTMQLSPIVEARVPEILSLVLEEINQ